MIELVAWTGPQARTRLEDFLTVYREAFLAVHSPDPNRAVALRRQQTRQVLSRPGFSTFVALQDHRLVGFVFCCPGAPGQWWHDVLACALPATDTEEWLADSIEIVELHVLPEFQGHGLGRRLLRAATRYGADGGSRTAVLSALQEPDSPARSLYAAEGFVPLLENFRFPGSMEPYVVLGKQLRPALRSSVSE